MRFKIAYSQAPGQNTPTQAHSVTLLITCIRRVMICDFTLIVKWLKFQFVKRQLIFSALCDKPRVFAGLATPISSCVWLKLGRSLKWSRLGKGFWDIVVALFIFNHKLIKKMLGRYSVECVNTAWGDMQWPMQCPRGNWSNHFEVWSVAPMTLSTYKIVQFLQSEFLNVQLFLFFWVTIC